MSLAPIAFFGYNRPEHTFRALQFLSQNQLISESELFLFCDGPKTNAPSETVTKIKEVRRIASSVNWCKKIQLVFNDVNKGLAQSIVDGVTQLTNDYGKVIVLEDDLLTSEDFLMYSNQALDLYENENKLMHISGYMYPQLRYPFRKRLPETFALSVMACWGWSTWKRAWKNYQSSSEQLLHKLYSSHLITKFNLDGATKSLEHQLIQNYEKQIDTWAIKWNASIFLNEGLCLFPKNSLVRNIGNDGSGIHSGSTKIYEKQKIVSGIKLQPITLIENELARNRAKWFYHFLEKRKSVSDKVFEKLNLII